MMIKIPMIIKTPIIHRIRLVIIQVLLMDNKTLHTIKGSSLNVVSTVKLTMKDLLMDAYLDKEKVIFPVNN